MTSAQKFQFYKDAVVELYVFIAQLPKLNWRHVISWVEYNWRISSSQTLSRILLTTRSQILRHNTLRGLFTIKTNMAQFSIVYFFIFFTVVKSAGKDKNCIYRSQWSVDCGEAPPPWLQRFLLPCLLEQNSVWS
jgi:hypothetical protein